MRTITLVVRNEYSFLQENFGIYLNEYMSGCIDGNACNAPDASATILGIFKSPAREHGSNDAPRLNAEEAKSLKLISANPVSDVRPPNLDVISARPDTDGTDTYAVS